MSSAQNALAQSSVHCKHFIFDILLTDNFTVDTQAYAHPPHIFTSLRLLVFSHPTNPVPALSHWCFVSLPLGLTCISDRLHSRTTAYCCIRFIHLHHHSPIIILHGLESLLICFNLRLILSWDAGEDCLCGYWLSWLAISHIWIDNLTYYVPVLLHRDVLSELLTYLLTHLRTYLLTYLFMTPVRLHVLGISSSTET